MGGPSIELALGIVSLLGVIVALYRQRAAAADKRVDELVDCERRCADLAERCARLEIENETLTSRIERLEEQVRTMRSAAPLRKTLDDLAFRRAVAASKFER